MPNFQSDPHCLAQVTKDAVREQGFDDPIGLGAMPAGSGIPFRMDGPRVSNEHGGNTPFLMQMRDRIRKKFR